MHMKKLFLLTFGLLFSLGTKVNAESKVVLTDTINGKDITRLENYLVYYSYNSSGRTPANQWGYEISVNSDNFVVECGTNVTVLPGGYAISGHGTKKTALMNVRVGDYVEVNLSTLKISILRDDVKSSWFLVKTGMEQSHFNLDSAISGKFDFDRKKAEEKVALIDAAYQRIDTLVKKETLNQTEINSILSDAANVKRLTEEVVYITSRSHTLEIRALWHRPNASPIKEENLDGVKKFVERVHEVGYNTIFVETFWNGYASYRSEILETHPKLAAFTYGEYQNDYIAALIGEANKLGIAVHAWVHTFNAGSIDYKSSRISDSWLLENYQGKILHPNIYGGSYYMDPSNPEVLDFMERVYEEMTAKYDFAGIQLDYIRYYDNNYSSDPIRDSGYGDAPERKFKDTYQIEGDVRTLILNNEYRKLWNTWRQNNVTEAVRRFSKAIREVKDDVIISADIVPNIEYAKATYMQDWKTWVERGYVDLLCPMIYTGSTEIVRTDSEAIKNSISNLSFLAAGISPIAYQTSNITLHEQVQVTSATGGSAFFASQYVIGIPDVESCLKQGAFRNPAVSPLADPKDVVSVTISRLTDYSSRNLTESDYREMFLSKLHEISESPCNNPSDYQRIIGKLENLSNLAWYIKDEAVRSNFIDDLRRLIDALDIKISRSLIRFGYYDPTSGSRPDPDDFEYPEDPKETENPMEKEPRKGCFSLFSGSAIVTTFGLGWLLFRRRRLIQ